VSAADGAAQKKAVAELYDTGVLGATGEPISWDDLRGLLDLLR